jgi:hypothetical protein
MRGVTAWSAGLVLALIATSAPRATAVTPSSDLLACQKQLERQLRGYAKFAANKIHSCAERVARCKLADEIDSEDPVECLAAATSACAAVPGLVSEARAKRRANIVKKCGLVPFTDMTEFVAGLGFFNVAAQCVPAASTVDDLVDCVLDAARCSTERQVFIRDPRAQDSLTTANVAASFPCVAP